MSKRNEPPIDEQIKQLTSEKQVFTSRVQLGRSPIPFTPLYDSDNQKILSTLDNISQLATQEACSALI